MANPRCTQYQRSSRFGVSAFISDNLQMAVRLGMPAAPLKALRPAVNKTANDGKRRKKTCKDPAKLKAKVDTHFSLDWSLPLILSSLLQVVNLLEEQMTPEEKALIQAQRRRKEFVEALQAAVVAAAIASMEASDLAQDAEQAAERAYVIPLSSLGTPAYRTSRPPPTIHRQ